MGRKVNESELFQAICQARWLCGDCCVRFIGIEALSLTRCSWQLIINSNLYWILWL